MRNKSTASMRGATAFAALTIVVGSPASAGGLSAAEATVASPAAGEESTNKNGASANEGLQEVIVTAQKRSEKLTDVPSSLTALSSESLQNQGVVNFSDYMTLVPSLSDFSGGAEGHGAVILRGLNTGFFQTSNTVGYYIDDIPFSATSSRSAGTLLTLDPDLTDIDHLEVLKGPQATLYGASTLGGLIKVVTKKPDLNSNGGEARLEGSSIDGGGNGYGLVGIANVVLVPGQLALRASGFDRENPGYMRNLTLGTQDRDLSRKQGGRVSLRWSPAESLDIEVSAMLQSLDVHGWNYEQVDLHTLAPVTGPYTYSLNYDPTFHTTYEVYNIDVNYTAGSVGTVTNSTSYAKYRDSEVIDYSPYFNYFNFFAPGTVPADAAQPQFIQPSLAKLTDELRFASRRFGAFEGLAGLFYTREQIGYSDQVYNAIPPSLQPIAGPVGNILNLDTPSSYQEKAVFADITYYFADTLDLTLGGRYSHNRQDATSCNAGFISAVVGCIYTGSSDNNFTYLAALRWQPAQGLNTYARIATSYRPGAAQFTPLPGYPATFKPDSLINYEVGLKGDWLDHRLHANLAVYNMVWKDVQMPYSVGGYAVTSNGGRATVRGVELETRFAPLAHLEVGVNVAYTHARLNSVSPEVSADTGAVAGDTLPFTPTWAASAVADYVQPLSGLLVSTYGLTYRYQGSKWSDYPGDLLNTGVVIPHYNTVDIRTGLSWGRYQLQARVANLFSARGLDALVDQRLASEEVVGNPPATAAIIQPRTYTLSLDVTF